MSNYTFKTSIGKIPPQWMNGKAKSISFCVTEDCNLRCKYCYMSHKNSHTKMTWKIAKDAMDFFLTNRMEFPEEAVIFDFIGGEPFLEIDLIDQITDYFKFESYRLDHPWFSQYRLNFSTNGLLYDSPPVQNYIVKNNNHVNIGVSIDGNKIKHDLQRVKPNGEGSFDDVLRIVPMWLKQFPHVSTKATFSHVDLPYLKESVLKLWEIGIKNVMANVVFEDVWHEGDDIIFENQIMELSDYILEHELWKEEYSIRFLDPNIGFPLNENERKRNYCGSGHMISVDCNGNLFSCIRFHDFSLNNHEARSIGSIYKGINHDILRPLLALNMENQSSPECLNCSIASGCSLCVGNNFDLSETGTIFHRATFNCKMHKANVRACEYFWNKFEQKTGYPNERKIRKSIADQLEYEKYLFILTSDSTAPHCAYYNYSQRNNIMDYSIFQKGLEYAETNGLIPVILRNKNVFISPMNGITICSSDLATNEDFPVYDNHGITGSESTIAEYSILLVNKYNIKSIVDFVKSLSIKFNRINIILQEINKYESLDLINYEESLNQLIPFIIEKNNLGTPIEVNVLTDLHNITSMCNCNAGIQSFTLAPNGNFYICPAFYFDKTMKPIGNLENGIKLTERHLYEYNHAAICTNCDVYHCKRCLYLNKKMTKEINTPSRIQCLVSHIERKKSLELQNKLSEKEGMAFKNIIKEIDYSDPLTNIIKQQKGNVGCL